MLFGSASLAAGIERDSTLRFTPAPSGPYRVSGNRILDAQRHPYLIRGTELAPLTLDASPAAGEVPGFGPFSASAFITIRQRMNMNAVRLPLNAQEFQNNSRYRARAKEIVRKANRFELLVILTEDPNNSVYGDAAVSFWAHCAAEFRDNPNTFFAVSPGPIADKVPDNATATDSASHWRFWLKGGLLADRSRFPGIETLVDAIRSSGARQPIVAGAFGDEVFLQGLTPELLIQDPDIIYETAPRYATTRTDRDRWTQFGLLSERVPVLANGLDPELDRNPAECAAFPRDPAAAGELVEDSLTYFDAHFISWTISSMRPGRLISDYRYLNWTKLDHGWTCGEASSFSGVAMVLLSHLWKADVHGIFAVNQTTGGFLMARGGISTAYGPILADREMDGGQPPWPTILGNVSVRVTDSRGVGRLAPLLHTGGGWAQITFIVPENTAPGPAEVAVVRSDGTSSAGKVLIADVAAGIWTAAHDGRGPVIGQVLQRFPDGRTNEFPAWECSNGACRTVAIPLSDSASTTVRLEGTGFRHAGTHAAIRVTVDDIPVPVVSFGPTPGIGRDQLTIQLPGELRGHGETDLVMTVDGALSNVVRINCGTLRNAAPGKPAPAAAVAVLVHSAAGADRTVHTGTPRPAPYPLTLPRGFPKPPIPPGNPITEAKVRLGRYLFYDKRMSLNGTTSCATCHRQELAFTDGLVRAVGATGQTHPRSAMSLVNLAYNGAFNWSDPTVHSLEEQALKPMFSTDPIELGLNVIQADFLKLTRADPAYRLLFPQAFREESNPHTIENIAKALAAFERTIVAGASPYDRFRYERDGNAISESAKRGEVLFFLDGGPSCFRCHGGFNFSDAVEFVGGSRSPAEFHNTGLYNLAGPISYPLPNAGLYQHTKRTGDIGKFKAPTLRNIALTAPYMHDGSIATLGEVLDHYAAGGRTIADGPFAGVGHDNPTKDKLIHGFYMTPRNRADLVAFLDSLTDEGLIHDPRFADPWR